MSVGKYLETIEKLEQEIVRLQKRDQELVQQNEVNWLSFSQRIAELEAKLAEEVGIDSLTGLKNHGRIEEDLKLGVARALRARLPLCLAVIDVDLFKVVNDTYGHLAGDKVLRGVADALKAIFPRKVDLVGRWGGDEFVVVLTDTSGKDAEVRLNLLRQNVESSFPGEVTITVSVGIAELYMDEDEKKTESSEKLFERADQALRAGKKIGRNRVYLAEE